VKRLSSSDMPVGSDSGWEELTGILEPVDGILPVSDGLMDVWGGTMEDLHDPVTLRRAQSL
jgi:phosphoserine phosphatase RsbU/P